jgi:biotin carboxylase
MPFVIYATSWFPETATNIIAAIAALPDVRLAVVSQEPFEALPADLRPALAGHWRVDDLLDTQQIIWAARELAQRHGPIDRLFGAQEQTQIPLAEAREQLSIVGMSVETARNFRDKARMKELLRAAGIPCARYRLVATHQEAWRFAEEVGYPIVAKPPAGAASQTTYRADEPAALQQALDRLAPTSMQPVLLEEFITGDEHSLDTFSLDGRRLWHSLTHYYPTPLEVLQNPWIQWVVLLPREVDDPRYDDIREDAARTLDVLGMQTGLTHLEWFRRRDGSLAVSEVAARPPGAQFTTLMSRANEFDSVGAWARLMVFGAFDPPERRYAAGAAYLRAQGQGDRITAIHGFDEARRQLGDLITDVRLPQIGAVPSTSYEGDGYVIVRHPETAVVREALSRLVSTMRVERG